MSIDPDSKAARIVAYHLAHPEQTRPQIAAALGLAENTVRTVASKKRLAIPSLHLARVRDAAQGGRPRVAFKKLRYAGAESGGQEWNANTGGRPRSVI